MDPVAELASIIEREVHRLIKELKLDMDYGVEIYIASEDLDDEVLREVIKKLLRSLKITYMYTHEEPGYYMKKIEWNGIDISLGIRPAIL